ncbi:MAG: OmpA family protein [Flavobacteriaceae bacterium]|nr:OmpA family protein [Flavobacteriaceae bacterium]
MKKGILLFLLLASAFYANAQSTGKYQIKFLEINKQNSDNGVAILDNNKLVFTSSDEKISSKRKSNPRKDLFIGNISSDGEIKNIKLLSKNKNTKLNKSSITYSSDKRTVYFSVNKYVKKLSKQKLRKNQRLELYKATLDADGNASNVEKLPFNQKKYSSGYPVLSGDNTKLYFVSDRLPSEGKTDIFVVDILEDGKYSKPRNLGKNVNTSGTETTPFITENNILYFSSDGHGGEGNLDVFAVEVVDNATSKAFHLDSPINSVNNDFSYIINKEENLGFFTSDRLQGKNNNDLYFFTLERDVRPGECFISVEGKVKDSETNEIISGANVELYDMSGSLLASISTYNDGSYKFTVSCAKEYKIIASNENYVTDEKRIDILEENYHSILRTNLNLNKIKGEKAVEIKEGLAAKVLQPIYFGFDKVGISDAAIEEMDRIVEVMKEDSDLLLEASAYTDSRGSKEYNRRLSQRRAKVAVDYIISKGIDKARVKGKGYGEEKLKNNCIDGVKCDEEAHRLNRRTEFNFTHTQASVKPNNESEKLASTELEKPVNIELEEPISVESESMESNELVSVESDKPANYKYIAGVNKKRRSHNRRLNDVSNKSLPTSVTKTEISKTDITEHKETAIKEVESKTDVIPNNDVGVEKLEASKTHVTTAKEVPIVETKPKAKVKQRQVNVAEDYIEAQKGKIIEKLSYLEKQYKRVIKENSKLLDSAVVQKERVVAYKKSVENMQETGWSNIINYKVKVKDFYQVYKNLMSDNSNTRKRKLKNKSSNIESVENKEEIIVENKSSNIESVKNKEESIIENKTVSTEDKSKKRIEESDKNLRVKDVEIVGMKANPKGKYSQTNDANQADIIKVSFKVKQNKYVNSGDKDAYIVVQSPRGAVTNALGVFTPNGTSIEKEFTDHTIIDYNNDDVNVVLYIEKKKGEFEKGIYPVELFLEGELVAISNLDLESI